MISGNDKKVTSSHSSIVLPPAQISHSDHMYSASGISQDVPRAHVITDELNCPVSGNVTFSTPLNSCWGELGMEELLKSGRVLLHSSSEGTSLKLPFDFWTDATVTLSETLGKIFEQELQWLD